MYCELGLKRDCDACGACRREEEMESIGDCYGCGAEIFQRIIILTTTGLYTANTARRTMARFDCLGCAKRAIGCHGTCESYKTDRKKLDEINSRRFAEEQIRVGLNEVQYKGVKRSMNRRGKKW